MQGANVTGKTEAVPNVGESNWAGAYNDVVDALYRQVLQSGGSADAAFIRTSTNPSALSGFTRLGNTEALDFRNAANSGNNALVPTTGDALSWKGAEISQHPSLQVTSTNAPAVGAAFAVVNFNNSAFDSDSMYSAGTITIPTGKGGAYLFAGSLVINAAAPGAGNFQVRLRQSGTTTLRQYTWTTSAINMWAFPTICWAFTYYSLAASTTVTIEALYSLAGNLTASANDNFLHVRRIREV